MSVKRISMFLLGTALLLLLCGCKNNGSATDASGIILPETSGESITGTKPETEPAAESLSVTFAKAETEIPAEEEAVTETGEQETERVLADNQLEYSTSSLYILMEFTGAEVLGYYPGAIRQQYREDDYVLHSYIHITNLSGKSFDFIPQKLVIYGRFKNERDTMIPTTETNTGLAASDKYYTVGPGESAEFAVDFIGDKVCIEHANEIKYTADGFRGTNNIDADELNNVAAGYFDITKRSAVKKAVSAALDIQEAGDVTPAKLTPAEGEYSVVTQKNSYCFSVEPVDGGSYVRVALRVQCLTGEPESFEPLRFYLCRKDQRRISAHHWSFDTFLTRTLPDISKAEISGVTETLYYTPFSLSVHQDGSAEYTMYFFTSGDDLKDYYMFSYDGENDAFECIVSI